MDKNELIRLKAGALALIMAGSMSLTGCAGTSNHGFSYKIGKDNKAVAYNNSYINGTCIATTVVAEVYNELTGEREIYIAKKLEDYEERTYYSDILQPYTQMFYQDNDLNNFLKVVKITPLKDYLNALGLNQPRYNHEDMQRIKTEIENVYQYDNTLELLP